MVSWLSVIVWYAATGKKMKGSLFFHGNWYCVDREEHLEEGNTFCDIGRLKG